MNIVVDSGNTYSKVGWFSGHDLVRFQTHLTFSELITVIRNERPGYVMYASVNKSDDEFREALSGEIQVVTLSPDTPLPIRKEYDTPETLGADRVAAAVGAQHMFPNQDVLVIDMGTCITYDLVDKGGAFQGGLISPGLRMRFKAMHTFTKRLPLLEPVEEPAFIGKSTVQAMESGVINGLQAEIDGIIERYRHERRTLCVVTCGGDAPFFETKLKHPIFAVPELVLIGLNRILTHNVAL